MASTYERCESVREREATYALAAVVLMLRPPVLNMFAAAEALIIKML